MSWWSSKHEGISLFAFWRISHCLHLLLITYGIHKVSELMALLEKCKQIVSDIARWWNYGQCRLCSFSKDCSHNCRHTRTSWTRLSVCRHLRWTAGTTIITWIRCHWAPSHDAQKLLSNPMELHNDYDLFNFGLEDWSGQCSPKKKKLGSKSPEWWTAQDTGYRTWSLFLSHLKKNWQNSLAQTGQTLSLLPLMKLLR